MEKEWICCRRPRKQTPLCFLWLKRRNRKAERERGREGESTWGSNDNKQITQEPGSLWTPPPVRKSAPPLMLVFALSFFYPFLSPEISFQQPEPCKNRPRVFKLGPVWKDVPACSAAPAPPNISVCATNIQSSWLKSREGVESESVSA